MTTIEQIKSAIESLPEEQFAQLRDWFSARDWEMWDREIEADSRSGRLDFLVDEALQEKQKGKLRDL